MAGKKLDVAIVKKGDQCLFYIDKFPEFQGDSFKTADKIIFRKVQLYKQDADEGLFSLPIKIAIALAKKILYKLEI